MGLDFPVIEPDQPTSAATRRPGRKPAEIPAEVLQRISALREAGTSFEQIRDALDAEFGLSIGVATLHAVWEREIEPATPDGQQIARWQRLFGLSKARWRRILADMRRRESATSQATQSASTPPTKNPQKSGEASHV